MAKLIPLALDLGQKLGWAVRTESGQILSGQENLEPKRFRSIGMCFLDFNQWLCVMHRQTRFDVIFFEEVRRHAGTDAAHAYGGFMAILTAWADDPKRQIPYNGVPVQTIKKAACGMANASKGDVATAMIALGHNPMSEDESDALALLHWAIDNYNRD